MQKTLKAVSFAACLFLAASLFLAGSALAENAFKIEDMSDMSDFDPNNFQNPTGDTFKIGLLQIFSGPGAGNGELFWLTTAWVAHDINKRGGIMIDGKKKLIEVIKGDVMGKPAATKKAAEKLVLEDKVDVLWGTSGSHLALVIQNVAERYKVIFHQSLSMSDSLMDEKNFNKYTFQTMWTTNQVGETTAYFYAQRKKEKKFYIICQDYLFGHSLADAFKKGLAKYYPEAEIVGEDYHPLFAKDFAPYLTKAKASGAEVIFTGDWMPDGGNLVKQARQLGVDLPFANIFIDEPNSLAAIGPEGTKGLVNLNQHIGDKNNKNGMAFAKKWNDLWKDKWSAPYNTLLYKWPGGTLGYALENTYWMLDVFERAGSSDPEKVIKVWEGDVYYTADGKRLEMRACDHVTIRDTYATEYVYPNPWFEEISSGDEVFVIPAEKSMPVKGGECK
ncbi:ABC-type branched-chain amino acid transport systems periplasmic component-like protein [Desulfatibacillum aliphaticivorans]|uniref:ABC-type branched-chain amino acid transport systems periplasmic component-like protein n=1 Tax=Desulfatibacillum aliphaticivorans TaxID=218208 RepID=B8FG08_DESAL|nr:ABC transporter substrate-binding protein [Desulfatibacillum aliphaticivorans]ACL03688.1 ABC-type branched-chain amino acid transport systems periplasmic component-like protein [Desulfatibacillum aliphaticivorans]